MDVGIIFFLYGIVNVSTVHNALPFWNSEKYVHLKSLNSPLRKLFQIAIKENRDSCPIDGDWSLYMYMYIVAGFFLDDGR